MPACPCADTLQSSQEESNDGPTKNYVLCSESEEESKAWMAAITEEIKPMIGGTNIGWGGGTKTDNIKVDQKAFDEVMLTQQMLIVMWYSGGGIFCEKHDCLLIEVYTQRGCV